MLTLRFVLVCTDQSSRPLGVLGNDPTVCMRLLTTLLRFLLAARNGPGVPGRVRQLDRRPQR